MADVSWNMNKESVRIVAVGLMLGLSGWGLQIGGKQGYLPFVERFDYIWKIDYFTEKYKSSVHAGERL